MADHPLDGIRSKIERAKQHVYQFNHEIASGRIKVSGHDLRASYQHYADLTQRPPTIVNELIFTVSGSPPPVPPIFSILAAECFYHLRSCLDHLVYQLIVRKTNQPPTFNSAFPIVGKGRMVKKVWRPAVEEYEAQTSRLKQDLTPTAMRLIDGLQPFKRGTAYDQEPLWIVNELNNTDKHRLILLAIHAISEYFVTVTSRGRAVTARFTPGIPYERGQEIGRMPFHDPPFDNAQVDAHGDLILEIAFAEVCGRKHVPVIPLLTQLAEYINGVVRSFEGEF